MEKTDLIALARATAERHGHFPSIICGMVQQESGWNTWALNPEPHYGWLWDFAAKRPFRKITPEERRSETPPADFSCPPHVDRDAEWWCQQMSWGLLQMMGAAARECGFAGRFLSELCDPAVGWEYGCRHFTVKLKRAQGNMEKALLLWNGGGNPAYPSEVLAKAEAFR